MFYTVYKTTNVINQMVYVGVHQTDDPYDDYMGSGILISRHMKKHGKADLVKEVLHIFNSPEEAYEKEAEIVDEKFVERCDTYNLKLGGLGGGTQNENSKKKLSNKRKGTKHSQNTISKIKHAMKGKVHSESTRKLISEKAKERKVDSDTRKKISSSLKNRNLSYDHKLRISESQKGKKQENVECPHCKKEGGISAMKRHHFDNCKFGPTGEDRTLFPRSTV